MGGDPAAAAQANQQFNQQQAEAYLAQQKQDAITGLMNYIKQNPDPASTWGAIAQPNYSNSPAAIGGGTMSGGPTNPIVGALGGWTPTGPQGTPPLRLPQSAMAQPKAAAPASGGGGSGKTAAPRVDPGTVARAIGGPTSTGIRF